jgi:hypothetical protein
VVLDRGDLAGVPITGDHVRGLLDAMRMQMLKRAVEHWLQL